MSHLEIDDELLLKFVSHQATDDEKQMILQWLHNDPKNKIYLDKLIWSFSSVLKDKADHSLMENDFSVIQRKARFRKGNRTLWLMAASVVGLFFSIGFIFGLDNFFSNDLITVVSAKGEKRELHFSDGTNVVLAPDSKLIYPEDFDGDVRSVELEGEAYFDVAHNADLPFVVRMPAGEIVVLGTKFNVKAYPKDQESSAALVEGIVQVQFFQSGSNAVAARQTLAPLQKAIFNKSNGSCQLDAFDPAVEMAWQNDRYVFYNKCFGEIVHNLERLYNVTIVVTDEPLLARRFTGEFGDESIEEVLHIFKEWTNIQFEIRNNTIYINKVPM